MNKKPRSQPQMAQAAFPGVTLLATTFDELTLTVAVTDINMLIHAGPEETVFCYEDRENGDHLACSFRKKDLKFLGVLEDG